MGTLEETSSWVFFNESATSLLAAWSFLLSFGLKVVAKEKKTYLTMPRCSDQTGAKSLIIIGDIDSFAKYPYGLSF